MIIGIQSKSIQILIVEENKKSIKRNNWLIFETEKLGQKACRVSLISLLIVTDSGS